MICYACGVGDDARKGDVNRYAADEEAGLLPGNYHAMCALSIGFNEWDEEK